MFTDYLICICTLGRLFATKSCKELLFEGKNTLDHYLINSLPSFWLPSESSFSPRRLKD